ncbi:MAG: FAD binding domain-containing protein, partial [Alphaproteobacteria bacterium]
MHDFAFHRPTSLKDARALFARCDDASYLAGGMTLLPTLKQRLAMPSDLIDLSSVGDVLGITITDSTVTICGMTPHAMIE